MTPPLLSPPLDPLEQAIAFAIEEVARIGPQLSRATPSITEAASVHAGTSEGV